MARPQSAALAWPQASAGWVASPGEVASPGWLPPADQAAGLRHLFGGEPLRRLRVLSVTGGSVGSGKSAIVADLARHAAPCARVLVLDQTANEVARHAGVTVRHDLFDVVSGRLALDAVAVRSGNWRLLPAQRGLRGPPRSR